MIHCDSVLTAINFPHSKWTHGKQVREKTEDSEKSNNLVDINFFYSKRIIASPMKLCCYGIEEGPVERWVSNTSLKLKSVSSAFFIYIEKFANILNLWVF
jgi:hypothetical protein